MPKDRLYAREKMLVAAGIVSSGLDLRTHYVADFVDDAQAFIAANRLAPSDEVIPGAVAKVTPNGNKYLRIYNDGRQEEIPREAYVNEVIYNYLPQRFKTYVPE